MKTIILYNVNINNFSSGDEKYLSDGRVIFAITNNHQRNVKNTIFLTWDDRTYHEDKQTWDEKLSPSPIDRVCDFISDIWEGSESEREHLLGHIKHMNMSDTIHYDMENFTFDVRTQSK